MFNVLKPAPNFTDSLRCKVEVGSVNRLEEFLDTRVCVLALASFADDVCVANTRAALPVAEIEIDVFTNVRHSRQNVGNGPTPRAL